MLYCPTCASRFSDELSVCPEDGTELEAFDRLIGMVVDGKFRVDGFLGAGAMGAVYEATQLSLGRTVALKVVRQDVPVSKSNMERFKREAMAVARLKHPNIVTIYDAGVAPGFGAYTVMEHLKGRTLHDLLESSKKLSAERAAVLMGQMCSAVHAAHEVGVIHRDLKPHNIFLEEARGSETVKVLDFGIAKLGDISASRSPGLTRSGALLGTPLYMSPEQCSDLPVDSRSDVYALGCVLYEMLTGRPPFSASSVAAILVKHLAERPKPPRTFAPEIPRTVEDVILRALSKNASDRQQSALELAQSLTQAITVDLTATTDSDSTHLGTMAGDFVVDQLETAEEAISASDDSMSALRTTPNNLPETASNFAEQVRIAGELRDMLGTARIVTLTGPSGVTKTQLAGQVASEVLEEFPDGVWFVEVAPLTKAAQLPRAVAAVLGMPKASRNVDVGAIAEFLGEKRVLLVLDHCDHIARGCAVLVAELLSACPGLRVIASAARPLGVGGESIYRLGTLGATLDQTGDGATGASTAATKLQLPSGRRRILIGAAAVVVALLATLSVYFYAFRSSGAIDSIAILPFAAVNADEEIEYLSDGIAESIINDLSRLPNLRVLARTTVFRLKGKDVEPSYVGRELGVRAMLTGRVARRGNAITIQVELVDTSNGTQLWGDKYERQAGDLQSVQNEIAAQITRTLKIRMTGDSSRVLARRATDNGEAYQLYLQGRYHLAKQTADDWRKAVAAFEKAIALDANYALAHAGLADAYVSASNVYSTPNEAMPRAKEAAIRALEIDPELAEGHVALGQVRLWYEWDWSGAESELRRAVEANRGYAPAHYQRGFALLIAGRFDDAEREMREAQKLDPLSLPLARDIGSVHYFARKFDLAEAQYRRALELDPSFKSLHTALATTYVEMGRHADAVAEVELVGDAPGSARRLAILAYVLARSGDNEGARARLAELHSIQERGEYVAPVGVARAYAALGMKDEAFEWLEKAFASRADTLVWCKVDPRLDPLRSDPRFDDLLRRVGVPAK